MSPEHLSNQSFSTIPHDRSPQFLAGDDTEAASGTWGRGGDDGEVAAMRSAAGVEDALKLPAAADTPRRWQSIGRHWGGSCRRHESLPRGGHSEALTPLRAPAREDLPALLGGHPDEEPVGPLPVPPVRLKSTYALGHDY